VEVFAAEVANLLALDVEDADDLVLVDEGDGEFAAYSGVGGDVVGGVGVG
jgi:hypothetical protein